MVDLRAELASAAQHAMPVRLAVVVAVLSGPPSDTVRMQIHRREVIERCQCDAAVEVALHGGVARVAVLAVLGQIGDITLDVLEHFRLRVGAVPD